MSFKLYKSNIKFLLELKNTNHKKEFLFLPNANYPNHPYPYKTIKYVYTIKFPTFTSHILSYLSVFLLLSKSNIT